MGDAGEFFANGQGCTRKLFDSDQLSTNQMAMLANPHFPMALLAVALIV
jgi:hypothetical protein